MADAPFDPLDTVPEIQLRIPGPWASQQQFMDAVTRANTGYEFGEGGLVDPRSGRRFTIGASDPDDQIAGLFAHTGRLPKQEVKKIAAHRVKVHLHGPGGSVDAAKAMMAAAAALIKAGGYGVFVDNSGNAHGRDDWLALAGDRQAGGFTGRTSPRRPAATKRGRWGCTASGSATPKCWASATARLPGSCCTTSSATATGPAT